MNPQDPYQQPQAPVPVSPPSPAAPPLQNAYPASPAPTYTAPQPQPYQAVPQPQAPVAPAPLQSLGEVATAQPATAYPADYLDRIAATPHQKTASKFAIFGMIFAVIIVAIIAVIALSSSGGTPNFSTQAVTVEERLQTLEAVATNEQGRLSDNRLRTTNATFSAALSTMDVDLTQIMKSNKIKSVSKVSSKEAAYQKSLEDGYTDAYLLGTLDRTYASQMAYELTLLKTQLRRLKLQSDSKSVASYYDKSLSSVDQAQKEYSAFAGDK